MADGICDLAETPHPRNWVITRLDPFATIELCDDDLTPGLVPLLAANLGVDFDVLYAGIEKVVKAEARKADKELADAQAAEAAAASPPADTDGMTPEPVDRPGGSADLPAESVNYVDPDVAS